MTIRPRIIGFVLGCSAALLGTPQNSYAACDQTLSVGANVAAAAASAANGTTICLNSGNYGTVGLSNISRSGFVTIQSTTGTGAQVNAEVYGSKFIKLANLTIQGATIRGCSTNIEIWNSTFVANSTGLLYNYDTACPGISNMALVVDGVTFDRIQESLYEGRLSVRGVNGLTIRNSVFSGEPATSPSDGIQLIGGSQNITIGPGNTFTGILESLCGSVHCDAIQLYGAGSNIVITGNMFKNGDTFIMAPDGSDRVTISNNVFDGSSSSYQSKLQMGTASNAMMDHNTIIRANAGFTSKIGSPASTNSIAQNNILIDGILDISYGSGCTGCTLRYNLFNSSQNASGTNAITGTPLFVGGSLPTTWAGWQLTTTSPGHNAGNDGRDMGTNYYGPTAAPKVPSRLRIVP
jgi:hypothetical protein